MLQETRKLYDAMYLFDVRAAKLLGIHVTDLRAVNALEKGPLSAGELSERLGLTSGSVTTLIGRLENVGFVERVKSSIDTRRVAVSLKPHFYKRADRVYGQLGLALTSEFSSTPDAKKQLAAEMLNKMTEGFLKATNY
jgi:DNA-binding MarR family transcriptional regulator